jgi:hypothetical protein
MMRTIRHLCLALLLCLTILPGVSQAEQPAVIRLSVDQPNVHLNETLTVKVSAEKVNLLYGNEIVITFDASKLQFVGSKSLLSGGIHFNKQLADNQITLVNTLTGTIPGLQNVSDLYAVTFKAVGEGAAPLSLTSASLFHLSNSLPVADVATLGNEIEVNITPGTTPNVPVTGITLDNSTINLKVGGQQQLTATVLPADATNKAVTWSTSASTVATVDATGKVTAVAAGTAILTATTVDDAKTASATIHVSNDTNPGTGTGGTPPPTDPTVTVIQNKVTLEAKLDEQGKADVTIQADDLAKALQNTTNSQVIIDVKPQGVAKGVQVEIPVDQLLAAGNKKVDELKVDTGLASITVSTKLLDKEDASKIQLSVVQVDKTSLSATQQQQVGQDTKIYDFNLFVDGQRVSNFSGHEVKVEIPYALKPGEKPNQVVLYYLMDDGKLEIVNNGKFNSDTGMVEFYPKHFSKYMAAYTSVTFDDLTNVAWAQDAIQGLAARGVVQGVGENRFNPEASVTRAEFIAMLVNAFNLSDTTASISSTDVHPADWYYNAIASASKLGIVQGQSDTMFGANERISRQDMAVMVYRALNALDQMPVTSTQPAAFTDQAEIRVYAQEAVAAMQRFGLIQGMENGTFAPGASTTRAQAATLIYRLF